MRWAPLAQGVTRVSSDARANRLFAEHNGAGLVAYNGAGISAGAWRHLERRRFPTRGRRSAKCLPKRSKHERDLESLLRRLRSLQLERADDRTQRDSARPAGGALASAIIEKRSRVDADVGRQRCRPNDRPSEGAREDESDRPSPCGRTPAARRLRKSEGHAGQPRRTTGSGRPVRCLQSNRVAARRSPRPAVGEQQVDRWPVRAALLSRRHGHRSHPSSLPNRVERSSLAASADWATNRQSAECSGEATRRGSSRTAGCLEESPDLASGAQHDDPSARTGERGVKPPLPIDEG